MTRINCRPPRWKQSWRKRVRPPQAPAAAERDAAIARQREADARLATAEQAEGHAQQKTHTLAEQVQRWEVQDLRRRVRVRECAESRATWEVRSVQALAALILVLAVLAAIPAVTGHLPLWLRGVFISCGAVSALAFAGQLFFGGHVMHWSKSMHDRRVRKHERRILSRLLLDSQSS